MKDRQQSFKLYFVLPLYSEKFDITSIPIKLYELPLKNIGFFQCIHTIENVFINKNPNFMKKLIFILCMLVLLALTSCSDMYAQSVTITIGGIYYEYAYNNIPVTIVDGVYYWYIFYNDAYYWKPLPRRYHGFVHHFDRPRYYAPHNYRLRPHIGNRPPMRPNVRSDRKPDARPNRRLNTRPNGRFTSRSSQLTKVR